MNGPAGNGHAARDAIVAEARSWLGTPWHHMGRVKAAGVDCAQLLLGVYQAVGCIPEVRLGYYPPDWHLHQDRPRFIEVLARHAVPVAGEGLAGDVAMFRYGRHAAHGAIVAGWPLVIHAYRDERAVTLSDAAAHQDLARRFAGFWRLKALA